MSQYRGQRVVSCCDCQTELDAADDDTIYDCISDAVRCRECWRGWEAHLRWERFNGWPTAQRRQRRIEQLLAA